MRIAITQRVIENSTYSERRDTLSQDWSRYLIEIIPDCIVLPVPNIPSYVSEWSQALDIDAVVLSNGNDWLDAPDRDQTEEILLEYALSKKIPVLGVCRGFQVINGLFGGQIESMLKDATEQNHVGHNHSVRLVEKTFSQIARTDCIVVNSYHNQGVIKGGLAHELKIFAMSDDGVVVEGIYHPTMAVLAVQWHPERAGSTWQFDAQILRTFFLEGAFWK